MAEPAAPFSITPLAAVETTVSAAKRSFTLTTRAALDAYLAGTGPNGFPTWGDDVILALATFAGGDIMLPPITHGTQTGNDYVTFRSANLSVLPPSGQTVSIADAVNMPTLTISSGAFGFFRVQDNVSYYRFVGLNLVGLAGALGGLFLQAPSSSVSTSVHPHHILVDRCLIHFDSATGVSGGQGIQMAGRHLAVMNCLIYEFWNGSEPHAVLIPGGIGPYRITQNEMQVNGCAIFVGDNQLANAGIVPADITVTENYLHVPPTFNVAGFLYNTGTANLNLAGNVVTLVGGVTDPTWNDGSTYWLPTGPRTNNGYYKPSIKIIGVNLDGANTIRLASAWPDDGSRNATLLNYHVTKWDGRTVPTHKNLWEAKHAKRVKLSGNIFARSYWIGGQVNTIALISNRGENTDSTDLLFENNLILDCAVALTITTRPGDGSGQGWNVTSIDGSQGGLVTIHASANIDIATHNGNVEIRNCSISVANGIWPATYINSTTFTIPVAFAGTFIAAQPGSFTMYKAATPSKRIAIKNNLIVNPGSPQCLVTEFPNSYASATFILNVYPILVATGGTLYTGGNDGALSTSGVWSCDDFLCEHNTVVGPRTGGDLRRAFWAVEYANSLGAVDWKSPNWTFRNNVIKATTNGANATSAIAYSPAATNLGSQSSGTAALDLFTDVSRSCIYNAFFNPWSVASDQASLTGADATLVAIVPDQTSIGFVSYAGLTAADITNYILQNLYTVGSCTVVNGNATVNFSGGASLPTTIVKGVPFKGPDGLYYLVNARVSATQLTLQTAYLGPNAGGAYILGFRGWSSDGTDPGANITTLAAAIAHAGVGSAGGSGGGGAGTGSASLTGRNSTLGFALIPQTP